MLQVVLAARQRDKTAVNRELTKPLVEAYLLRKPLVTRSPSGELRLGEDGRGLIRVLDMSGAFGRASSPIRVAIYDPGSDADRGCLDDLHEAFEWCLGGEAFGAFSQLYDAETEVLSGYAASTEELDRIYRLAAAYFSMLADLHCLEIQRRLRDLREVLRSAVSTHVRRLV